MRMKHTLALALSFISAASMAGDFVLNYESIYWSSQLPSEPRQIRETLVSAEYQDLEPSFRNGNEGQLRVKIEGNFNDLFIHDKDGSHASELKCLEQALQAGQVHSLEMHTSDLGRWANHRGQTSLDKVRLRLAKSPETEILRGENGLPKVCEALAASTDSTAQPETNNEQESPH
jgi:hypothetical protein